ncbi:MAG: class I SAM-dependent methyltransferase [Elusimicrobiota bacterium]|jgi:hypothetical protein|nr:class I SAM-dependent methyltransferase [Elusimicrobiota bacterium]
MDVEKLQKIYNEDFYLDTQDESYLAGFKFLSFMRDIFPNVKSVIDVGCGIGTWLKAFKDVTNHGGGGGASNVI